MKALRQVAVGLILTLSTTLAVAQKTTPTSDLIDPQRLISDLEILSSDTMEGRRTGTAGSVLAQNYIAQRFQEIGLSPIGKTSYFHQFKSLSGTGVNVMGMIAGQSKSKYIVITAHYDHLGVDRDDIYNGADDNASGVVGLFALAKYFKDHPPQHNLLFIAFDAEESGLVGSAAFVANPIVPLSAIAINLNLDMISQNGRNELYVVGTQNNTSLRDLVVRVRPAATVSLLFGHSEWQSQSDHYSFYKKGIPYLYFGVEDHEHYHNPSDDFATIPQDFFVRSTESILMCALEVDRSL